MKGFCLEKIKIYCEKEKCEFGKSEVDSDCLSDHPECCEVWSIPIDRYFDEEMESEEENNSSDEKTKSKGENNSLEVDEIWHTLRDDVNNKIEISNLQRFRINGEIKWTDNVELLEEVTEHFYPGYKKKIQ